MVSLDRQCRCQWVLERRYVDMIAITWWGANCQVIFTNLLDRLPPSPNGADKTLILAHRHELLMQAKRHIELHFPHRTVSLEMGRRRCDPNANVILASVATIGRLNKGQLSPRLLQLNPLHFKAVIIDEAHHSAANTYRRVIEHFQLAAASDSFDQMEACTKALEKVNLDSTNSTSISLKSANFTRELDAVTDEPVELNASGDSNDSITSIATIKSADQKHQPLIWGCSATLCRFDHLSLGSVFEKIVYHMDTSRALQDGWLCPVKQLYVYTDVDLSSVKYSARQGDLDSKELSLAIDTPMRNHLVAATWFQTAHREHSRRSTIVFALTVSHAHNLAAAFENVASSEGLSAVMASIDDVELLDSTTLRMAVISASTETSVRQELLRQFSQGSVHVLFNCAVLTEGTDLPRADCIVMTRPTCNRSLYIQMAGRGLRKFQDKQYCLVLDFVDRAFNQNRTLISFPSLLQYRSLSEQTEESEEKEADQTKEKVEKNDIDPEGLAVRVVDPIQAMDLDVESSILPSHPGYNLAWISISPLVYALVTDFGTILLQICKEDFTKGRLLRMHNVANRRGHWCTVPIGFVEDSGALVDQIDEVENVWQDIHLLVPRLISYFKSTLGANTSMMADAHWRRRRPPSRKQLVIVRSIIDQCESKGDGFNSKEIYRWSMGQAADFISKHQIVNRLKLSEAKQWTVRQLLQGISRY